MSLLATAATYAADVRSTDTPFIAVASESDRSLQAAIEALSSQTKPQGLAGANMTGDQKKPDEIIRYKTHHHQASRRLRDKTLILGGAEAFSM